MSIGNLAVATPLKKMTPLCQQPLATDCCYRKSYKILLPFSPFHSFMTPLHVAAERAHNDVMEVLHKHGAKVGPAQLEAASYSPAPNT